MTTAHDHAQRESQPVPYWPGKENVWDAMKDGLVRESSDFDSCGVLALKAKTLPFQRQTLERPEPLEPCALRLWMKGTNERRVPLGQLDKATQVPPPLPPPPPPPAPDAAADAALDALRAEIAALEEANAALERKVATMGKQITIQSRLICSFIDFVGVRQWLAAK